MDITVFYKKKKKHHAAPRARDGMAMVQHGSLTLRLLSIPLVSL